ncbi:hypothetical protein RND71_022092 [Anisodus tanguticus]|uniref:Methyltransferase domain-containing protein n=1 Tax=Anisodus tanguticus TaxID=243964 RepID=A0AAE1RXT5_9SOLA|nr:hypothetical protein RND71_022092 [Anisodus tanguticus]
MEQVPHSPFQWQILQVSSVSLTLVKLEWRYLLKEFPELASCGECSTVLEVGCGNGSTALPILRGNKSISLYACDCSEEALERAKENIEAANSALLAVKVSSRSRICAPQMQEAAVRKISPMQRYLPRTIAALGSRFCYLNIYAISSATSQDVESNHRMLLCLYGMTMLRFEPEQRVGYREYMRSDGTRSYFFFLDSVRDLFCGTGFTELELEYCCVQSVNRRNGKIMRRVWIHGKFQKPHLHVVRYLKLGAVLRSVYTMMVQFGLRSFSRVNYYCSSGREFNCEK